MKVHPKLTPAVSAATQMAPELEETPDISTMVAE